ncbi:hypothetical protein FHR90_003332 [Endobacter medicaginis]|nr:hypothetical protein [Endobacter medicaginis]MBB3175476.1 hypothetical protein [Endobacter medicaginis]MCX5477133.1 hypothetical protein [Endobacter medicaginis]
MRHGTAQGAIDETIGSIGYWTGAVAGLATDIIAERQAAARNHDATAARRIDARTAEIQRQTAAMHSQQVSNEMRELEREAQESSRAFLAELDRRRALEAEVAGLRAQLAQRDRVLKRLISGQA